MQNSVSKHSKLLATQKSKEPPSLQCRKKVYDSEFLLLADNAALHIYIYIYIDMQHCISIT